MARAAQRASPVITIEASYKGFESEESSATGPCALSGAELTGGVLLEGNMSGEPDGVAELEGTPAEGAAGTSASGELTGVDGKGDDTGVGLLTGAGKGLA